MFFCDPPYILSFHQVGVSLVLKLLSVKQQVSTNIPQEAVLYLIQRYSQELMYTRQRVTEDKVREKDWNTEVYMCIRTSLVNSDCLIWSVQGTEERGGSRQTLIREEKRCIC